MKCPPDIIMMAGGRRGMIAVLGWPSHCSYYLITPLPGKSYLTRLSIPCQEASRNASDASQASTA